MIKNASELLQHFIQEEKKKLAEFEMPHMPTLGSAYEEVTKQGIDKGFVIPKFLDLRVVSGFIAIGGRMLPQQIDCMLVEGEGKKYGLTSQFIYDMDRVLCIFEVKKTLKKADYIDAFDHLGDIRKEFAKHFEEKLKNSDFEPEISHARKSFAQITGKIAPVRYLDLHRLPEKDAMLFYTLVQEQHAPASIVHGYGGYKTEEGIRKAFIDIIENRKKLSGEGIGVTMLPSLVTSNDYCLIKGNGHPYLALREDCAWVVMSSTRYNPARLILEVVWAKIESHGKAQMPYGDDLSMEKLFPLLIAEPGWMDGQLGWIYNSIEYKEKSLDREEETLWEPENIGPAEMSAIEIMALGGGYLELNMELDSYLLKCHGCSLTQVVDSLIRTRVFAREGNYLRPLASVTHVLANDDNSGYVAVDQNRFDAWCKMHSKAPDYMNIMFFD
ncbi:hypothetical protein UZ73_00155 [Alcaligenes faecalis]|uniref:DUF6602 domain-containing protein n=1 Tax=Alcaligenes faecalis TaxID=511 RepID=UPI0005F90917|nr:DUF6602 domain-containing protein [Alcaligenes faecalis]ALO36801.1 hypothetical protein UZ73_00155 [Alcaligenes faecalis]